MAFTSSGWQCPVLVTRTPEVKSRKVLPSTSVTTRPKRDPTQPAPRTQCTAPRRVPIVRTARAIGDPAARFSRLLFVPFDCPCGLVFSFETISLRNVAWGAAFEEPVDLQQNEFANPPGRFFGI